MTEETSIVSKYIKTLTFHANNYEKIFLELSEKKREIPEDFINNYLELIYEINKHTVKLEKTKNERKDILRATI